MWQYYAGKQRWHLTTAASLAPGCTAPVAHADVSPWCTFAPLQDLCQDLVERKYPAAWLAAAIAAPAPKPKHPSSMMAALVLLAQVEVKDYQSFAAVSVRCCCAVLWPYGPVCMPGRHVLPVCMHLWHSHWQLHACCGEAAAI